MTKRSTRWATVARNLADAKLAAACAAASGGDGGTCNMDHVILESLRWSEGLQRALDEAGVRGRRTVRHGRACVSLDFGDLGQANANARACEAASSLLRARGLSAYVYYMVD